MLFSDAVDGACFTFSLVLEFEVALYPVFFRNALPEVFLNLMVFFKQLHYLRRDWYPH